MNIVENLKMAFESIKTNKMRSFLTMLGIVIGIASVIMIIGVGQGGKQYIMGTMEDVGSSTVMLSVSSQNATQNDYFTFDDVEALSKKVANLKAISPYVQGYGAVSSKSKGRYAMIYGGNSYLMQFAGMELVSGRGVTEEDYAAGRKVCAIDDNTAMEFFGNTDVAGIDIDLTIKDVRTRLKIVGVYSMGSMSMGGMMPSIILIPATTYFEVTGESRTFSSIYLMGETRELTDSVGSSALRVVETRHSNRDRDCYQVQNLVQQVDALNSVISIFTSFIAAVAAISLLVGGIGVMNIMLVSVTERTREIGIRKSLGAKTGSIQFQFLTESAILALVGGFIGLALGILGAYAIGGSFGITPVITLGTIALALLFSCGVGILFGVYPARKAARLNPIEALRHE